VYRNPIETTLAKLFGSRSDAALKAIVQGPIVQEALSRAEAEEVQRRAKLVKQLADLPKVHEKRCIEANEAVARARKALDAAHAAVSEALARHSEAYCLAASASAIYGNEESRLTMELNQSADPRIADLERACDDLHSNHARHAPMDVHVDDSVSPPHTYYDASAATAACEALRKAVLECRALRLKALTSAQITAAMSAIVAALVQPLAKISLKPPVVESHEAFGSETVH
jgi:hypothetical protein